MKKNVAPKKLVLKGHKIGLIKDNILDLVRQDSIGDVEYSLVSEELEIEFWSTNRTYDNILSELGVYDLEIVEEHVEVTSKVAQDVQDPNPIRAYHMEEYYYVLAYTEKEAKEYWRSKVYCSGPFSNGEYLGQVSLERALIANGVKERDMKEVIENLKEKDASFFPLPFRAYSIQYK